MLVETDAGTTASTGLSKKAKARTAKEDCHRPKPAKVIYPSTQTDRQTINGGAADGSAFLWNTNPQDNGGAADGSAFLWNTNPQD